MRHLPILEGGGGPREGPDQDEGAAETAPSAPGAGDVEATGAEPSRRDVLRLFGASLAAAGLASCGRGPLRDDIRPYVHEPEDIVPGKPSSYATSVRVGSGDVGVLVTAHTGRPTKIEGNDLHPGSDGAAGAIAQASLLSLYDPDRSDAASQDGRPATWRHIEDKLGAALADHAVDGSGLRVLTGAVPSPSLADAIERFLGQFPGSRWHAHEPLAPERARRGAELALGEVADVHLRLGEATVVAAFDSDFLFEGPGAVRYARDFAARRDRRATDMLRLYAAEPMPTVTGAAADHRIAARAGDVHRLLAALAGELGVAATDRGPENERERRWLRRLARDLEAAGPAALVTVGERQPPEAHALALAITDALGALGRTVVATDSIDAAAGADTLESLLEDIDAGEVETLIVLGANPVATAPDDLAAGDRVAAVAQSLHVGLYSDETAKRCRFHVPEAHPLESWGDGRAFDGTVSMRQPVIRPIYGGRSALEILSLLSPAGARARGAGPEADRDRLRAFWTAQPSFAVAPENTWRRALHDGVVPGTALPPRAPALRDGVADEAARALRETAEPAEGELELCFAPHPRVRDGRDANNEWLQELPDPITQLTWDNPAIASPATAEALGAGSGDEILIRAGEREARGPLWIVPGHADGALTLHLGYGRELGRVASGAGFRAEALRESGRPWRAAGAAALTGARWQIATTQHHHRMEGRDLIREATAEAYEDDPEIFDRPIPDLSLYPDWPYPDAKWAMVIDLSRCIGCGACMLACQAENNIPVVGKEEVLNAREMHWIRVDTYYAGEGEDTEYRHQPVTCMHCERAPCEVVCPVQATVHSDDGLNDMVYNRCIGTRYCSNNCPYKVRRFNFYDYSRADEVHLQPRRNPDVTVRSRGVMEKCTYCVQRISAARIDARNEDRPLRDGDVRTACQQACPSDAIVFGDANDPDALVSRARQSPRNYGLLEELNTRPRTTYLAKLTHPARDPDRG